MMDRRFKSNFDKLFRPTAHRSPVRRADDIDARLEKTLVLAKRIGDVRRRAHAAEQAEHLRKARALLKESRELAAQFRKCDLEIADVNARLDWLELERLMEN